jgi:hypothetical protein
MISSKDDGPAITDSWDRVDFFRKSGEIRARSISSEDPARQGGGGRPVAGAQGGEGEQAARIGVGAQRMAATGGPERRERVAGTEPFQTFAPSLSVRGREGAEQAEVALAAPAGVGPLLHGPAGRASDGIEGGRVGRVGTHHWSSR